LGHETGKIGIEDPNILQRCNESDVSVWSDDDDRASATVNPICRISLSTGVQRDGDVVNENPKPSAASCQSYCNVLKILEN